ncbi:MAG TPA: cobalamin-binding protein [Burkholderiaceae bacterium]|jgi:iron complex transport system substrate-binding protein|nr:cobalamin-binding protein [Burkholderiaceae bacterium]
MLLIRAAVQSLWTSRIAVLLLCTLHAIAAAAPITVQDDAHHTVTLVSPAQRIISLAPHATELLFAAGAGNKVVGVSDYSDYPLAAKQIASVGGSAALDLERILALKPDLLVVWGSGNAPAQVEKLRKLGIPIFESEPRDFADIPSSLERLATLTDTQAVGHAAADAFRTRLQQLTAQYQHRPPVKVFYQIWHSPLMSLNDDHLSSKAIRLCGGENIFGKLPQLAPTVNTEAVLQANPEVIVTGGDEHEALSSWRQFPHLLAVKQGNLFTLNTDTMTRGSPRILDGSEVLCKQLELARSRRQQ